MSFKEFKDWSIESLKKMRDDPRVWGKGGDATKRGTDGEPTDEEVGPDSHAASGTVRSRLKPEEDGPGPVVPDSGEDWLQAGLKKLNEQFRE